MSKVFYNNPDPNIPAVQLAALEALKYFICTNLYPDEIYHDSRKRFVRANFESGTEHAIRKSVKQFKQISGKFPFTAYSIGDGTPMIDNGNLSERQGKYYSNKYNTYVTSVPIEWTIPMISLFTQPSDYFHAKTILLALSGKLQRLTVPILINGQLDSFEATVIFEITKGALAFDEIEQENKGKIFDILHNCIANMHYYIFDTINLQPVEDIEMSLKNLPEEGYLYSTINHETPLIPDTPGIASVSPIDGETGVDPDATLTNIIIDFDVPMNEISVENAIDFYPAISANFIWNGASTQLIIDIVENLVATTEYTIDINNAAKSVETVPIENDYIWSFTTI